MAKKLILDVDTGGDDAVALMLAGHHPAVELVAATVVHGNAPLSVTLDNTLRALQAAQLSQVPVYAGAALPLLAEPLPTDPVQHKQLPFPEPHIQPQPEHAVRFLIDYYMGDQGPQTTFAPVGPLTNLALALLLEPALSRRIPEIITMGGAYIEGNTTPSAEFNILADPEAARIVYAAGIPITMVGLEVTAQALVTLEDASRLKACATPQALAAAELIRDEVQWFIDNLGASGGQIYDACAIGAAVDPTVLTTRPMYVDIEVSGKLTRGRTVADISGWHKKPANVQVGTHIDRDRFVQILFEGLG
jgi:ribosylpyrimidine nucleosidase